MSALPVFQSQDKNMSLMQTSWKAVIDPVIAMPINSGHILQNIALISGTTVVNHQLQRKLQGWFIVRWHGASASIYDTQDANVQATLNLSLVSNSAVTVDIFVF